MTTLSLQVIKDEAEYEVVVERITQLFDASPVTPEGDELKTFLLMVDTYQKEKDLLIEVEPAEVIKFMMSQRGLTLQDIAQEVGGEERACQILSGKSSLTPQLISTLSDYLHIPIQALM